MAAGAVYVEELVAYQPGSISAACRRWAREQARWPTLSELLLLVEQVEAAAERKPVESAARDWQDWAEEGLGHLADCYIRRIRQLTPEDHDRFGREFGDYVSGIANPAENSRLLERWADEWLGVDWWRLMGPVPEPIKAGRTWTPPKVDTSGLQRVVVEPEAGAA